jgi:hypothetical protein
MSEWLEALRSGVFRRRSGNKHLSVAKLGENYQHYYPAMTVFLQEVPGFPSLMYRDQPR